MNFENQYSLLDQWLHRFSFASNSAQIGIADMEDRLYASELKHIRSERPVFVTALPRAGTTILLNLLVGTGKFASHVYRDMPFVLCPMLWQRFAKHFQQESGTRERAHGDGVSVSADSPEALEEMIWKPFWQAHYKEDKIRPWKHCDNASFQEFFYNHMRKIIALRSVDKSSPLRYASKNNLNIARIRAIPKIFPDCIILLPFREPLQHAASLLRQHRSFLSMHKVDRFSARYMAGIGHYDFGENLKPINFDAWLDRAHCTDPQQLAFWLQYWTATYRHVLSQKGDSVHLVSTAALTEQPNESLARLADILGLSDSNSLLQQAPLLRSANQHEIDHSGLTSELINSAQDIYHTLNKLAVLPLYGDTSQA